MTAIVTELPRTFCWTRFGSHAGESIEGILARKESERRASGGTFLWGIGNSVAAAIDELVAMNDRPEVLFSPIKSRPRAVDLAPALVVTWTAGEALDGRRFPFPPELRVRSHQRDGTAATPHYALVCSSQSPLSLEVLGRLDARRLRNLLTGHPIGASQVTAVVERLDDDATDEKSHVVALRARLIDPFFVRLREPVAMAALPRLDRGEPERPQLALEQRSVALRSAG